MYSAYSLFNNGKKVAKNGKVSDKEENFIPYWQYQTVDLSENPDTLKMVLHIANFYHSKAGISKSITQNIVRGLQVSSSDRGISLNL